MKAEMKNPLLSHISVPRTRYISVKRASLRVKMKGEVEMLSSVPKTFINKQKQTSGATVKIPA